MQIRDYVRYIFSKSDFFVVKMQEREIYVEYANYSTTGSEC